MKNRLIFSLILLTNLAYGFQDSDLDGIEDGFDQCPNTPFDAKVNQYGCDISTTTATVTPSKSKIHMTISVGTTYSTDKDYDDDSSLNFYANFRYDRWDLALSNIRSMNKTDYTQNYNNTDDDIYLSLGYTYYMQQNSLKLIGGTKITAGDTSNDNRDNDYFGAISLSHFFRTKQDIFLYYGYTVSGDSPAYDYQDYSTFSIGSGYQFSKNYYSAISYSYTGSIYDDGEAQENILWYNSYSLSKNLYVTGTYSYALKDFSYDNTYALAFGLYF